MGIFHVRELELAEQRDPETGHPLIGVKEVLAYECEALADAILLITEIQAKHEAEGLQDRYCELVSTPGLDVAPLIDSGPTAEQVAAIATKDPDVLLFPDLPDYKGLLS